MLPVPLLQCIIVEYPIPVRRIVVKVLRKKLMKRGIEGARHTGDRCVVIGMLAPVTLVDAFESRIVTPDSTRLIPQQLLAKPERPDTQPCFLDIADIEPGVVRDTRGNRVAFRI